MSGFEGTLGFDGIAVALIAQNSPIAIAFAAIFSASTEVKTH